MPSYIFYAIAAAILNSFLGIYQKLVSKYSVTNFYAFTFYSFFLPIFFTPFLFLFFGFVSPIAALRFLIPQVLFFFLGSCLLYSVIFKNEASNINPLFPLKLVFVPFIAYFILGEVFSTTVYIFILFIICGAILVSIDESFRPAAFFKKGNLILILALFSFAMADVLAGKTTQIISPFQTLAWQIVFLFPFSLPFWFLKRKAKTGETRRNILAIFGMSFMLIAVVSLLYQAFAQNVTLSNSIAMANGPLTLLLIVIIGKTNPHFLENHTLKIYLIRIGGSLLMYVAALGIIVNL